MDNFTGVSWESVYGNRMVTNDTRVLPQTVRWGPPDDRPAGVSVWGVDASEAPYINWVDLKPELERKLLPQLFADPTGYSFSLADYNGKEDWLVEIVDSAGVSFCHLWFGGDPLRGWQYDGFVRVGISGDTPEVWQIYQRFSDGSYRRLASSMATIDAVVRRKV